MLTWVLFHSVIVFQELREVVFLRWLHHWVMDFYIDVKFVESYFDHSLIQFHIQREMKFIRLFINSYVSQISVVDKCLSGFMILWGLFCYVPCCSDSGLHKMHIHQSLLPSLHMLDCCKTIMWYAQWIELLTGYVYNLVNLNRWMVWLRVL